MLAIVSWSRLGAGEMTHFAVEKSTNGEVSEKACAADALASKATADERCMIQL